MTVDASVHGRAALGVARTLAVVTALFWAVPFFGLVDLAVPILETPGFYEAYLLETGWGVLYTFLVAMPLLVLAVAPRWMLPLLGLAVVAASLAVTAVVAASWVQLAPAAAIALNAGLLATLVHRRRVRFATGWRADPVVGALALLLTAPALAFAVDLIRGFREGRPPTDDDTWGIDHWPTQAALALAVGVLAWLVAVGVRRGCSGTVSVTVTVAVAAGWFGYWSLAYPDHAGSAGDVGGAGLFLWACTFVALTCCRLRAARATIAPDSLAEVPG